MRSSLKTILTLINLLFFVTAFSQASLSGDSPLLGKWVNKDTGILISADNMNRIYKKGDKWSPTYFANNQFYYIDTAINQNEKLFEVWVAAQYTSHREYLIDGSETSIETVDYIACRLELIDKNTLCILVSDTYSVDQENTIPKIRVPNNIKADFAAKRYTSTLTLTRLSE
jgi:hypothetical protein